MPVLKAIPLTAPPPELSWVPYDLGCFVFRGVQHCVQQVGSMMTLFFKSGEVRNWTDADQSHREQFAKYFWGMIDQGIYMPCSQFEALFISRTHTTEMIDQTIEAAERVLSEF